MPCNSYVSHYNPLPVIQSLTQHSDGGGGGLRAVVVGQSQSQSILAGVGADRARNVQSRLRTVCGQLDPVRRLQNTAVHPPLDLTDGQGSGQTGGQGT